MALTDDLVSFWHLDEASGTREDAHGSNHLAQSGGVGVAAGRLGSAADFDGSDDYLEINDNASLSAGDIDLTLACWVYFDSVSGVRDIAGKWSSGGFGEYWLDLDSSGRLRWRGGDTGGSHWSVSATTFGAVTTGTWYFVVGWHDAAANEVGISVNGTTSDTASWSAGAGDNERPFRVGAQHGAANPLDGRVDAVAFWKRKLSASEITQLYNSGNGLDYPFAGSLLDFLVAYYPLDEPSGSALDAHGSKDLTESGTVGAAAGKVAGARDFEDGGSDHFGRADGAFSFQGDFTAACWIRPETLSGAPPEGRGVVGYMSGDNAGDWWLSARSDGALVFGHLANAAPDADGARRTAAGKVSDGVWAHVAVRKSGGAFAVFVNGTEVGWTGFSTGSGWADVGFSVGRQYTGTSYDWDGLIDEVGVWSRALSDAEVAQLYNSGAGLGYPFAAFDPAGFPWPAQAPAPRPRRAPAPAQAPGAPPALDAPPAFDPAGLPAAARAARARRRPPAPPGWLFAPLPLSHSALLAGLVSYWKLEEGSAGDRLDSHDGNHLAASGSTPPSAAPGVLGNANFFSGTDQQLSRADNASLSAGDVDFTWALWVRTAAVSTHQSLVTKGAIGSSGEYVLEIGPTGVLRFRVEDAGGGSATAVHGTSLSPDTWYHVVAWHDSAGDQVAVAVNAGAPATAAHSAGVRDGANALRLGISAAGGTPLEGALDGVGFWKRLLSEGERAALYNGGLGLEYPFDALPDPGFDAALFPRAAPPGAARARRRPAPAPALAFAGEPTLLAPLDSARFLPAPQPPRRPARPEAVPSGTLQVRAE